MLASVATAGIPIAVKRGQKTVDPKSLPFACLAIETAGMRMAVQSIEFLNVGTHKKSTAMLDKTFGKPDYLTALDANRRLIILTILRMDPGEYEVESIEFNPEVAGGVGSLILPLERGPHVRFDVKPGAVNYVGSIAINIPPGTLSAMPRGNGFTGKSWQSTFQYRVGVEQTEVRDARWATDLIPAMVTLPTVVSPIRQE